MHGNCYRSRNLSRKYLLYPHQQLAERIGLCNWISHVLHDDQRVMRVFLATAHLLRLKNEGHAFLYRILKVDESWMHSFDPQLKRQNPEWRAQKSPRKKISRLSHDALKVMHVTSSGEMDLFLPITCQLV